MVDRLIALGDQSIGRALVDSRNDGREPPNPCVLRAGEIAPCLLLCLLASERLQKCSAIKAGLRCEISEDLLVSDIAVLGIERRLDEMQERQWIPDAGASHDDYGSARWFCVVDKALALEKVEIERLARRFLHVLPMLPDRALPA